MKSSQFIDLLKDVGLNIDLLDLFDFLNMGFPLDVRQPSVSPATPVSG
jgi:hypothetical protein